METCPPSEKRTTVTKTLACVRNLSAILIVAIAAVVLAAVTVFLRSTVYFLRKQTFTTEYRQVGLSQGIFDVFERIPIFPNDHQTRPEEMEEAQFNLVIVLDFWERMINIQSGLRRLVNIGVESGFTVVEPFMFESRISPGFSDPYHFTMKNMTPQPAMHYFQTEDLVHTNSYITYAEAMKRLERAESSEDSVVKSIRDRNTENMYVIQAAVLFDWPDEIPEQERQRLSHSSLPFRWCDNNLRRMVASNVGYMLSHNTFIERAVCLSVEDTISPAVLTPQYFRSLFQFVRKGTSKANGRCDKCVALAFMNYRKHAFNGFRSNLGTHPFTQKVPPLEVGTFGKDLAERIRTEVLRKKPYVAIQMRTGKMFVLFEKYENKLLHDGINITRYSSFKTWLRICTRKISFEAKAQGRQLGKRPVYYIASDMFNDGWKGGEKCPDEVEKALDEAKSFLSRELRHIYRFDPEAFGVRQDMMGVSGIADAAVCRDANRFLYSRPSNFGRWIAEQRELAGIGSAVRIDCMDDRLHDE